jgi:hypothetical protein
VGRKEPAESARLPHAHAHTCRLPSRVTPGSSAHAADSPLANRRQLPHVWSYPRATRGAPLGPFGCKPTYGRPPCIRGCVMQPCEAYLRLQLDPTTGLAVTRLRLPQSTQSWSHITCACSCPYAASDIPAAAAAAASSVTDWKLNCRTARTCTHAHVARSRAMGDHTHRHTHTHTLVHTGHGLPGLLPSSAWTPVCLGQPLTCLHDNNHATDTRYKRVTEHFGWPLTCVCRPRSRKMASMRTTCLGRERAEPASAAAAASSSQPPASQ